MESIKKNGVIISIGLFILLLFSLIIYILFLYQQINDNEIADYSSTENRLNEELSLLAIKDISRFHGANYFHVAEAETTDQDEILIFANQTDRSADLILFSKDELYSINEIINKWEADRSYEKLYQTQYGIRNNIPLIEIIYLDQNQRLSYDYYRLDNGEFDNGISFANN